MVAPVSRVVELCREALPQLQIQPLDGPESHAKLYVERDEQALKYLHTRLLLGGMTAKAKHHVFSGHIGGGKSSELYNLKRRLEGEARATVVFFSVKNHVNLVGLDATSLLEAIARALNGCLRTRDVEFDGFEERVVKGHEDYRRVRRRAEAVKGSTGLDLKTGVVAAEAGLEAEHGTREEYLYEAVSDPSAMLALVNELIARVRAQRAAADGGEEPPIVLFVDDLEKLDLATAAGVFSEGLALSQIDACVVFTVPISLLYSERNKMLLSPFDDNPTVLPIIKVRDRSGQSIDVTPDAVDGYIRDRLAEPSPRRPGKTTAAATVNRETANLRTAFRLARKRGKPVPELCVTHVAEHNARQGFLEADDFHALVAQLSPCLADMARFSYITGWRRDELRDLRWESVDLKVQPPEIRLPTTKNGEARSLTLVGALADVMQRRFDARAVRTRSGQDGIATHVRNLVQSGAPTKVAVQITGHKTTDVFRRYHIVTEDDKVEALEQAMRRLGEGGGRKVVRFASRAKTGTGGAEPE